MTYTTEYHAQRAALLEAIATVANVGRVHDRPRYGDAQQRWVTTIGGKPVIRSWELSPEVVEVNRREQGRRHRYRTWAIRGVVGVEDTEDSLEHPGDTDDGASFHVIQTLAGEIADAIDSARAAHVAAGIFIDHDPTQIGEPQVVTIGGGALCWGITLTVTGYTILTP